jgi:hypothetical protein
VRSTVVTKKQLTQSEMSEQSVDQQWQKRMEMDQCVEHVICVEVNVVACQSHIVKCRAESGQTMTEKDGNGPACWGRSQCGRLQRRGPVT